MAGGQFGVYWRMAWTKDRSRPSVLSRRPEGCKTPRVDFFCYHDTILHHRFFSPILSTTLKAEDRPMIKRLGTALVIIFIAIGGALPLLPHQAEDALAKLHRAALVWDCHTTLAYRVLYEGRDIGKRLPGGHA